MKKTDLTVALALISSLTYTAVALFFAWNEKEIPDILTATFLGAMLSELFATAYVYRAKKKYAAQALEQKIALMKKYGVQPESKDFKTDTENDNNYYTGDDTYG